MNQLREEEEARNQDKLRDKRDQELQKEKERKLGRKIEHLIKQQKEGKNQNAEFLQQVDVLFLAPEILGCFSRYDYVLRELFNHYSEYSLVKDPSQKLLDLKAFINFFNHFNIGVIINQEPI